MIFVSKIDGERERERDRDKDSEFDMTPCLRRTWDSTKSKVKSSATVLRHDLQSILRNSNRNKLNAAT